MFANRQEAGKKLAQALGQYKGKDVVVLALPRGGIVLGDEVATELRAPLDVVLVRKIGHPVSSEYAVGAVVLGEKPVHNQAETIATDPAWFDHAVTNEEQVSQARKRLYYGKSTQPVPLKGKTAIIVDDGIATGLTMQAAVRSARAKQAKEIIVAVPVAPSDTVLTLQKIADRVIVLENSDDFLGAVGAHYQEFAQVDDETVRLLLQKHRQEKDARGNRDA